MISWLIYGVSLIKSTFLQVGNNMKKAIVILSLILSSTCFSQSEEYESCAEAKALAQKDFNNELYYCKNIDYVDFVSIDNDFESFFANLIYSKYSIIIDHFSSKISNEDFVSKPSLIRHQL